MDYQMVLVVGSKKDSQVQVKKVTDLITELKGKPGKLTQLGQKKLAYPIKGKTEGEYFDLRFCFDPRQLPVLKKEMFQKELVLRFLLLKKENRN